ncbi:hypothetical protein GCM10010521_00230 [Streptomyces rameus]|uniref:Uncharacterized protein n=1 Tax=Streptomyces rameus TaxID=68261 RepID=A0ABP6MJ54_9ACTN
MSVWDSRATLPAIGAMDPGRVGQHGLEIVLAVCQTFCVHREPVGRRVTSAIELADDPAGSPPAPHPTGRTLSRGWSRTRRLLRQCAPSLPPVPCDSTSRIREPVGLWRIRLGLRFERFALEWSLELHRSRREAPDVEAAFI